MKDILIAYRTELLKSKNSSALWLVTLGALFIPAFFVGTIVYQWKDYIHYLTVENPNPWLDYSRKLLNGVHFTYFPLLLILLIALLFNIEHKSNAWKHVFTLPISKAKLFIAKYLVLITLILLFYILLFIFYLAGGYLLGLWKPEFGFLNYSPAYAYENIQTNIVSYIVKSFISILSVVAIHFWLSFRIKNLFTVLGIGLGGVVLTIGMYISHWESLVYMPYGAPILMCNFTPDTDHFITNFQVNSLFYFGVISIASFFDFVKFYRG